MYDFDTPVDRTGTNSLKWETPGELPMWVADMDLRTAPEITQALLARAEHGVFGYSTVPQAWYDAYVDWWEQRHGFHIDPAGLYFCTGVIPAISSCVRRLTQPAESVVILTPVYNIFFNCIQNNGRTVRQCPLRYENGVYDIDFPQLEAALAEPQTTLLLLCDPHNPVGKIWDRETLAHIGELAEKYGVLVISDEIHCDLTDPGCEYVPYASASETCRSHSVICLAPTKCFNLAGLQTAAVYVPDARLRYRVWRGLNTDEVAEPNAFAVQAAVAAFTKGAPWLEALRDYLYSNKQLVQTFLETHLPEIRLVPSQATYLLWLDCTAVTDNAAALAEKLRRETGLRLSDGVQYGRGGETFLRMNIACPASRVRDGLERLLRGIRG